MNYKELLLPFLNSEYKSLGIFIFFLISINLLINTVLQIFIKNKNLIDNIKIFKWIFLIVLANYINEIGILDFNIKDTYLFTINLVLTWLLFLSFLNGFYVNIYLKKIKKEKINHIFIDLTKIAVFIILFIIFLKKALNLDPSSILTSSAILTGIIGLSMQDTIGSLISGLLIKLEKPFDLGDWIKVKDLEGRVVEISWRYTKIQTLGLDYILIPNNSISKDTLINYSQPVPKVFKSVEIGVDLNVPPVKVKNTIKEVLQNIPDIAQNLRQRVFLIRYEDFRAIYKIGYYVNNIEQYRVVQDQVLSSIWYQFKKKNIEISLPKYVLFRGEKDKKDYSKIEHLISQSKLFKNLTKEEIHILISCSYIKNYLKGDFIVKKGEKDTEMYFILQGSVEIKDNDKISLTLYAGNFFGEMSLLTNQPRSADVIAKENVQCMVIDREGFKVILSQNKALLANIETIFKERQKYFLSKYPSKQIESNLWLKFKQIFHI
ncbi:MAG: mechanosensitive ion channel family protein [Desulfonauticus sp.]|nr:mechanosensitive ion channel family protein [Desulfonauticus sp.]